MGILEKAVAYRWATQGRGGGDDGMGPLGLILVILMGFFLLMLAIQMVLSFLYNSIRNVLLIAPNLTAIILGFLLAVLLVALIPSHSTEQASKYLSGKSNFTLRAVTTLVLLYGILGGMIMGTIPEPDETSGVPILSFLLVGAFFCYLYYTYQSAKLVGSLPKATQYRLAILFPLTTGITVTLFDLPIYTPIEYIVFLGLSAAFPLGILLVQYRVEPLLSGLELSKQNSDSNSSQIGSQRPEKND